MRGDRPPPVRWPVLGRAGLVEWDQPRLGSSIDVTPSMTFSSPHLTPQRGDGGCGEIARAAGRSCSTVAVTGADRGEAVHDPGVMGKSRSAGCTRQRRFPLEFVQVRGQHSNKWENGARDMVVGDLGLRVGVACAAHTDTGGGRPELRQVRVQLGCSSG